MILDHETYMKYVKGLVKKPDGTYRKLKKKERRMLNQLILRNIKRGDYSNV